jgi:dihydropteroate synthase
MGIVNVTPDSFSDGGRFLDPKLAVEHCLRLAEDGADILDIGGESTRPGAPEVPVEEEERRVLPVIEAVAARLDVPISIDTSKAEVARAALDAGAAIINDVTAGADPALLALAAERDVPVVLMHMKGTPRTMQLEPRYADVLAEIAAFLEARCAAAVAAGVAPERLIVDPGIGFGKTVGHNLEILARLHELHALGRPLLVGPSRKSFIGKTLGLDVEERLMGTAAAVTACVLAGAHIIRVHDVAEMRQVCRIADALRRCGGEGGGDA